MQLPGSSGGSPTGVVKCWHCCNNFDRPKVLHGCFHTFCESCLEKIQDHPEKITCPQCNTETMLGNAGISGLLSDYGIFGMMERYLKYCIEVIGSFRLRNTLPF